MLAEQMWDVRKRAESKMTVRYPFVEGRPKLPLIEMKGTAEVIKEEVGKSGMQFQSILSYKITYYEYFIIACDEDMYISGMENKDILHLQHINHFH